PRPARFPYTPLFRSWPAPGRRWRIPPPALDLARPTDPPRRHCHPRAGVPAACRRPAPAILKPNIEVTELMKSPVFAIALVALTRSEEHTSELQSREN